MVQAISTYVFLRRRLHASLLESLASTGAHAIEIYAARPHFDYTSRADVSELASWFRTHPVQPHALHAPLFGDMEMGRTGAPSINVVHVEKSRRIDAMDEIKRALESAEQIPFTYLVLHLGDPGDTWSPRTLEHSLTAVEHLRAFAAPLGVKLLLENLTNTVAQPENLAEIISVGHFRDVGVCFDIGHAHISSNLLAAIQQLAPHIRSVHVHDNGGNRDSHLWPQAASLGPQAASLGTNGVNWSETMRTLARLSPAPTQVLEIHSSETHSSLDTAAATIEADTETKIIEQAQTTFAYLSECAAEAAIG